ncbi:Ribonuclease H domain [Macleaya cordata]|uniref:Ribonuclease H domain n=1 Tax=Macleaya cordata TaxID=56857 RepID=A0A200PP08_MACCD|nr:Ribonuclease H domain [Macleaya cordata]
MHLATLISTNLHIWLSAPRPSKLPQSTQLYPTFWIPPPPSFIKINVDASWVPKTDSAGIGLVARDCAGTYRGGKSLKLKAMTAEQAEYFAVLYGVFWALDLGINNLYLEGDNQAVISFLSTGQGCIHWSNISILEDTQQLLKSFRFVHYKYVNRVCNQAADGLAKYAHRSTSAVRWFQDPLSFLSDVSLVSILEDTQQLLKSFRFVHYKYVNRVCNQAANGLAKYVNRVCNQAADSSNVSF